MGAPAVTGVVVFFNDTATTEIYTFPYTTLFRSRASAARAGPGLTAPQAISMCSPAPGRPAVRAARPGRAATAAPGAPGRPRCGPRTPGAPSGPGTARPAARA